MSARFRALALRLAGVRPVPQLPAARHREVTLLAVPAPRPVRRVPPPVASYATLDPVPPLAADGFTNFGDELVFGPGRHRLAQPEAENRLMADLRRDGGAR